MKRKWWLLIKCLLIPLAVGALSAWLSGNGMETFSQLEQPPLSPPGWLFPVVWTILYLLMGFSSWLVLTSEAPAHEIKRAMTLYGLQLTVNFFWSIIFFGVGMYCFAFVWLLLLWVLIIGTMIRFYRIRQAAGELLLPYFLWVTFAGYLNLGVCLLN
ncbi:MAG: tryptophan-rich sensory protein [Oscillospiraceae bacterium]|nr:tryptophan-rich sensory protein [Oscillospiraceae bacterium]